MSTYEFESGWGGGNTIQNQFYDARLNENKKKNKNQQLRTACTQCYPWGTVVTNREGNQVAGGQGGTLISLYILEFCTGFSQSSLACRPNSLTDPNITHGRRPPALHTGLSSPLTPSLHLVSSAMSLSQSFQAGPLALWSLQIHILLDQEAPALTAWTASLHWFILTTQISTWKPPQGPTG